MPSPTTVIPSAWDIAVTAATISRSRGLRLIWADEAAVDLQDVHLQPLKICERGIAGPEVIKGDAHAELGQRRQRLLDVAQTRQ